MAALDVERIDPWLIHHLKALPLALAIVFGALGDMLGGLAAELAAYVNNVLVVIHVGSPFHNVLRVYQK
jgi:hypothetical protein